jgi:hypothetical protein
MPRVRGKLCAWHPCASVTYIHPYFVLASKVDSA